MFSTFFVPLSSIKRYVQLLVAFSYLYETTALVIALFFIGVLLALIVDKVDEASDFFCRFSWQVSFRTPVTPVMDGMVCFHKKTMLLVGFIVFFVGFFLGFCVVGFF
jgi:hypothetical protein